MCKGVFTVREVIKRDGTHVAFDESKIYQAMSWLSSECS